LTPAEKFEVRDKVLTIKFDNIAMANHFKKWLCCQGEQFYWDWMGFREEEEPGKNITAHFNYHTPGGSIIVGSAIKKETK